MIRTLARIFTFTLTALALATPALSIPPPLPPADQFEFFVGESHIRCRLPDPAGPLQNCFMQFTRNLLSVRVLYTQDERLRYYIDRNCLAKSEATGDFSFANRAGFIAPGETAITSEFNAHMREMLELPMDPECERLANWPHEIDGILREIDRGLAVFRSLKRAEPASQPAARPEAEQPS